MNTYKTRIIEESVIESSYIQFISRSLIVFVGISGCFSVLFGAWLAHNNQFLSLRVQSSLATALQYQFIHTLALLISIVWLKIADKSKLLLIACIAFSVGIICFSCVIYIKAFFDLPAIGKLTPFGGISFAVAWLLLAFESKNKF